MQPAILAEVVRGGTTESVHRGHLIIIDGNGRELASLGDPGTATFFRSSCKPFQAIPLIASGAADRFAFDESEIALACASHSGEAVHVETSRGMLEKIGLSETDLRCGSHLPFYEKEASLMLRNEMEPTQFHNNCSGKHAAMLAVAVHTGADVTTYDQIGSPVQELILDSIAAFSEMPRESIKLGIDGCAAPNFAIPVKNMATSFANLVYPSAKLSSDLVNAANRIVAAMLKYPFLIGGSERLDTMLMEAAPGRIISKVGADGVWLCGILPDSTFPAGAAIALKVEDGDDKRARPAAAVHILRQLGILSGTWLGNISPMPIKNRRGDTVGEVISRVELPDRTV
ncbi:MAG: asparaginase [Pyrinomonadaceae bacterium]